MPYINASNVTSFRGLIDYANQVSEGWFSVAILISLFVIIAIPSFFLRTEKKGLAAAGFVTALVAILMRILNLIPNLVLISAMVLFFVTVFFLYTKEE